MKSALIVLALAAAANAVNWNKDVCSKRDGQIYDVLCCHDKHCYEDRLNSETTCNAEPTCMWQKEFNKPNEKPRCLPNRDNNGKVCCLGGGNDDCEAIVEGKCPPDYEMEHSCCPEDQRKWTGVLLTKNSTNACCTLRYNEPQVQARNGKYGCSVADARSNFFGFGGFSSYPPGPIFHEKFAPGHHKRHGGKLYYTGLEDYLPSYDSHAPKTESITVDDLMNTLVEALESEKDAFKWSSDTFSDPYLGKARFGGSDGSINLPDPSIYLRQIYGNHYGSALGQLDYRGYGGRPYSQAPHSVYGPGYFSGYYGSRGYGPGYSHRGPYFNDNYYGGGGYYPGDNYGYSYSSHGGRGRGSKGQYD